MSWASAVWAAVVLLASWHVQRGIRANSGPEPGGGARHPVAGPDAAHGQAAIPWRAHHNCTVIKPPRALGRQCLLIQNGPEGTVCTLWTRRDGVALTWGDPYLTVYIPPSACARLCDLKAGTYDAVLERGHGWDDEARTFRLPLDRRRTQRPLKLFGEGALWVTTYATGVGSYCGAPPPPA
jgi:hypothetical protein